MIPVSSARLTFRSWTEKDAALAEALWCDSEVTHYFGGAMTREQAHNRLDIERERENRLGVQYWPMFLRETGEFVGCAGLRQWQMDPKMIEAGVHLMRSSWGLRLGEEALRAVLAYGFETLGLPTIVAGHGIGHNNSQKLLERVVLPIPTTSCGGRKRSKYACTLSMRGCGVRQGRGERALKRVNLMWHVYR
jgi:[ribosomal protein S5]-alanine N-acetyltransferase